MTCAIMACLLKANVSFKKLVAEKLFIVSLCMTCMCMLSYKICVKDVLEALKSLSTFFCENNIRSRRNLRSDIERRSLVINEEFVDCFRQVKEVGNLLTVYTFVAVYSKSCPLIQELLYCKLFCFL